MEGVGKLAQMPLDEWKSTLATIGGELDRADYHLDRFEAAVAIMKARRKVAGGPVFGDPAPARSLYCEAAGFLSAMRTAIDIVIYVAARRSGHSISSSEKWEACAAMGKRTDNLPSKYDTEEITSLRRFSSWFETLNDYRNCMQHRGWHEHSFGYFDRGDSSRLANSPMHNIMLVPDRGPLQQRLRPDKWTYHERRWLDTLIQEVASGANLALAAVFDVWELPVEDRTGKIPLRDQPNVFLTVPLVAPIEGQSG